MTLLHPLIENAYRVLNGEELTEAEAMALVEQIHGTDIPDLISLANKVRNKFAGEIIACSIINAKSGHCNQNCRFCAQAQAHNTEIETYDLLDREEILSSAQEIYDAGVRIYGIVTSGYGYKNTENAEFKRILEAMDELHERFPGLKICASLGILSDETAKALNLPHFYCEKRDGVLTLRRDFVIPPGSRVLLVEDEVYTGQSVMEMREIVRALGAQVAGTICIVDKSMGQAPVPPPFASLYAIPVESYLPGACPLCAEGIPLVNQ